MDKKQFLKIFLVFLVAAIALIVNVSAFNLHEAVVSICAGINFCVEAYLVYKYYKDYIKEK